MQEARKMIFLEDNEIGKVFMLFLLSDSLKKEENETFKYFLSIDTKQSPNYQFPLCRLNSIRSLMFHKI